VKGGVDMMRAITLALVLLVACARAEDTPTVPTELRGRWHVWRAEWHHGRAKGTVTLHDDTQELPPWCRIEARKVHLVSGGTWRLRSSALKTVYWEKPVGGDYALRGSLVLQSGRYVHTYEVTHVLGSDVLLIDVTVPEVHATEPTSSLVLVKQTATPPPR